MDLKIVALAVFTFATVSAQTPPRICNRVIIVPNEPKFLCYVKQDLTHFQASTQCKKNGMTLFKANSPDSIQAIVNLGKSAFGGSSKARFYVDGRMGKMCPFFFGNGRRGTSTCLDTNHFVCEYPEIPKICSSFTSDYLSTDFVDATGITNPTTCKYVDPIDVPDFELSSGTTVAKESVLQLYIPGNPNVRFLPVELATNFPELQAIFAEDSAIATISYENLKNLSKLKTLQLDGNQLTRLDASVFRDVGNLRRLDYINPITHLSPTIFSTTLPVLESVYMDGLSTSCIDTYCDYDRSCVAGLPISVTNTCTAI